MGTDFEILDHTADIGIIARGKDLRQAFASAARGLFSLIIDPGSVGTGERRDIEVTAPDREALLVNWLNELIYRVDVEEILFSDFDITHLTETELKAKGYGEKIDPAKHHLKREVKAATYHQLRVAQTKDGWRVQVIFDI